LRRNTVICGAYGICGFAFNLAAEMQIAFMYRDKIYHVVFVADVIIIKNIAL
jgi:hypothetical protein